MEISGSTLFVSKLRRLIGGRTFLRCGTTDARRRHFEGQSTFSCTHYWALLLGKVGEISGLLEAVVEAVNEAFGRAKDGMEHCGQQPDSSIQAPQPDDSRSVRTERDASGQVPLCRNAYR